MLELQREASRMPQLYNQDYQMYNSRYIRPQSSPFSSPLLNPPENQTI